MTGFEWVPAMIGGLLAGLAGLVAGLAGAAVGLIAGLGGGLIALIAALGGVAVALVAGLGGLVAVVAAPLAVLWGLLRHARVLAIVLIAIVVGGLLLMMNTPARQRGRVALAGAGGVGGLPADSIRDNRMRAATVRGRTSPAGTAGNSPGRQSWEGEAPIPSVVASVPSGTTEAAESSADFSRAPEPASPAEADSLDLSPRQQLFSDVVDTWQADVYSSDRLAFRRLLGQVDKTWMAGVHNQEPSEIRVQGVVRHEILVSAVDFLKKMHPSIRITLAQAQDEDVVPLGKAPPVVVRLETVPSSSSSLSSDCARVSVLEGRSLTCFQQAQFADKPWLDDFAAFANEHSKKTYIVAISQRPATSADQSEQEAVRQAAASLEPRVRERMNTRPTGVDARLTGTDEQWLRQRIATELPDCRMIADRFTQRLEAPYGQIWQTSLLIDASPSKVAALASKCDGRLLALQRHGRHTALSVLGIIAVVCLVYAFLNAATKGYFVWSLRAVTLALIAGGVFLALMFRR